VTKRERERERERERGGGRERVRVYFWTTRYTTKLKIERATICELKRERKRINDEYTKC